MELISTQDRKDDSEYSQDLTPTRDRKENAQNSWLTEIATSVKFWTDMCLKKEEAKDQAVAAGSCWADAAGAINRHANSDNARASHILEKIIQLRSAWLLRAEQLTPRLMKIEAVAGNTQPLVLKTKTNPCDVPSLSGDSCPPVAGRAPEPILLAPAESKSASSRVSTAKIVKTRKKAVAAKAVKVRKKEVSIPRVTKARKVVALKAAKVREIDAAATEIRLHKRPNFSRLHVARCVDYCWKNTLRP